MPVLIDAWQPRCVLCAAHGRERLLEDGHVCPSCRQRIDDNLASIVANGDLSAVSERTSSGGAPGAGYESKPPTDLERTAPYLVAVRLNPRVEPALYRSVAELLCDWERMLRAERGMAAYGPSTAHHTGSDEGVLAAQASRQAVAILRRHLEWITAEPTWPIEDFADEVGKCAARIRVLASPDAGRDRIVRCPTLVEIESGDDVRQCGARLTVRTWAALDEDMHGRRDRSIGEDVTCPRCHATRSPEQLLRAAGKEDTWADAEALATWFGVSKRTLRRWAERGRVRRHHGLYSWADVSDALDVARQGA